MVAGDIDRANAVLARAYLGADKPLLAAITPLLRARSGGIAAELTRSMLQDERALPLLDDSGGEARLTRGVARWLDGLFPAVLPGSIDRLVARQRHLGEINARIGVPMALSHDGFAAIKRAIIRTLVTSTLPRDELADSIDLTDRLLEAAIALVDEVQLRELLAKKRTIEEFRANELAQGFIVEIERLRADLYDWMREVANAFVTHDEVSLRGIRTLRSSNFGLWAAHKSRLFLGDRRESELLARLVQQIDSALAQAVVRRSAERTTEFWQTECQRINDLVSEAAWLLQSLSEELTKHESNLDPLTRVYNRRYLTTILQREIELANQHGLPFTLLMLDVDHFKKVNDAHGHAIGDAVLRVVAQAVKGCLRPTDLMFRFGGEEFAVIAPELNEANALMVAERMREAVERVRPLGGHERKLPRVTISVGAATHDGHPDFMHLLKRADAALYAAKQSGRNRVVASPLVHRQTA
ncbi:MAG: GGDEF domain-containing protein [Alphaproteobacteria bacterium]|jgi:diguanylate cyclase|nr:GGDEF domain-containing protein [Alphaproteobacteria bacterium]